MLSGIRLVAILEALKEQWFGSPILAYLDSLTVAISSGLKRSQHFRFSSASQPASQPATKIKDRRHYVFCWLPSLHTLPDLPDGTRLPSMRQSGQS